MAGETKEAWQDFQSEVRSLFDTLGRVARDAKVRDGTRRAARSFGSALGKTASQIGSELEKVLRQPRSGR
mgnify:CR=1 FL=1